MKPKLDQIHYDILKVLVVLYSEKKLATSKYLTEILQTPHPGLTRKGLSVRMRKLQQGGLATSENRGFTRSVLYWQITKTGWLTLLPDSEKAPKERTKVEAEWDETLGRYKVASITTV